MATAQQPLVHLPDLNDANNDDGDLPPPYSAGNQGGDSGDDADSDDKMMQPTILILVGSFIHAESASSRPLYELSFDFSRLTGAESAVTLDRCDSAVRHGGRDGVTPRIVTRRRRLYELKRVPPIISPTFPFCLEPHSRRRGLGGTIGFRRAARPWLCYKAVHTEPVSTPHGLPKGYRAMRNQDREIDQVFVVRRRRESRSYGDPASSSSSSSSSSSYEWCAAVAALNSSSSGASKVVAVAVEDGRDGQQRLVVTAPLRRRILDGLVGCWCLRIWYEKTASLDDTSKWAKFKAGVRSERQVLPKYW
ncbi:hypothetical protein BX600DRAFT_468008 [Xylariales sp. PMI_506]|nr:hypothetical protein BX600DRAFT_468008 [Xylariales sp. PMI_506]